MLEDASGPRESGSGVDTAVIVGATGETSVATRSVGTRQERLSPETLRLYASDWARFAAYCADIGAQALPAAAETVTAFLASAGCGRAALRRRLAAIDHRHRLLGLAPPGDAAEVRAALKRARKALPRRTRQNPPSKAELARMARRCPGDLAGSRDRALLLLLASGLGRRDVVALQAERVRFTESGATIAVRDRHMELVRAPAGLCPVQALEAWLRTSQTRYGPVFRKVNRWGTLETQQMGADAVRLILRRRAST